MRITIFTDPATGKDTMELRNLEGLVLLSWPEMDDARMSVHYKLLQRFIHANSGK